MSWMAVVRLSTTWAKEGSRLDLLSTVLIAWMTVLWSRPPKCRPMVLSGFWVRDLARNMAIWRAVATACASNNVALAVPCHRVVRGDGSSGGYRWGVERKKALLNSERKAASGS